MSFVGCLQLVFIVMKLVGLIGWSWWWVLAPAWIAFVLILLVTIVQVGTERTMRK